MRPFAVFLALSLLALLSATARCADEHHLLREGTEWCDIWIPNANADALPRVLLLGDSITRAYFPEVEKLLAGKAYCARLATSRAIADPVLLDEIRLVLEQYTFAVIHFNNGMHGWGYTEEEYRQAFPQFVETIRNGSNGAKLIWANTTPVRISGKLESFEERTPRVRERNRIAAEYVAGLHLPVDDLFSAVEQHPDFYSNDGVHFNPKGVAVEAGQVAKFISEALGR